MKALFFEPHDDDLIIGAGGTVLQMMDAGWEFKTIQITDCRHGSSKIKPSDLIEIRREEKEKELDFLDIECEFLNFEDGTIKKLAEEKPEEIVEEIIEQLEKFRPDVVFMPSKDEGHPDHRGTHALVSRALEKTDMNVLKISYIVWQLPFLEGDNSVERVLEVEIDEETYNKKLEGIKLHDSQEREGRYSEIAEHYNSYLGLIHSSPEDTGKKRSEVLGIQNPDRINLLSDLNFSDVTEMSHGREDEDISVE